MHHRQDGAELVVASHWAVHPGEAGEADSVIELFADVTALKQAGVELRLALHASDLGTWRWDVSDSLAGLEHVRF